MKLLTVDTIDEARRKLLACARDLKIPVEQAPVTQARGRILARDIAASEDIPDFRRSTVDGYAVVSADTAGAGEAAPVFLSVAGTVEMGRAAGFSLGRGQCAYVPTGGMIPEGADAMVMAEHCEPFDEKSAAVYESAPAGGFVARIGEDAKKGAVLLRRGVKIRPAEMGALAAAGIAEVPVYAPLRIVIISTGDELVSPREKPRPGEVRDVNSWALAALAEQSGFRVAGSCTIKDDRPALENAVREALRSGDVVVLSGGSSQGVKDMTADIFAALARPGVFCHGMAIKPGKPTVLAFDRETGVILAGLPGHPVSALIVFKVLFSWLVQTLTGRSPPFPIPAKMSCNLAGSPGRTVYQPVKLRRTDKACIAEPVFGKAGMISTLTGSDGYVIIDLNREGLQKGEDVLAYLWGE
jgi:molybdopterin molybdotransferase